jgi:hypothetical protein
MRMPLTSLLIEGAKHTKSRRRNPAVSGGRHKNVETALTCGARRGTLVHLNQTRGFAKGFYV